MTSTIDTAFIELYNAALHVRYENQGFLYRGLTRAGAVNGLKMYWQRLGGLWAGTKARGGDVNFIDPEHTRVEVTMTDLYVGTVIDNLDLLKTNIAEREAHARLHMSALGRECDKTVRNVMDTTNGGDIGPGSGVALTVSHMNTVGETLILADAPMDGRVFAAVGPRTWSKMMTIAEFVNADYVGPDNLPYAGGMTAKRWRNIMWFIDPIIGLDSTAVDSGGRSRGGKYDTATAVEKNFVWHADAVGWGTNKEPSTDIGWSIEKQAHLAVSSMSNGCTVIEENGVYEFSVDTNA